MLNNQTIEKLKDMKLNAMAKALTEQMKNPEINSISFDDRFGMLVDDQWSSRRSNRITNLTQKAKFKFPDACIENIDYSADRKLDRELIAEIADGRYIREKNNVIIMGAAGAGKSFMGCAFGIMACRQLKRVRYIRLPELLEDMNIAACTSNDGFRKLISEYKKYEVLIIDEWLHRPLNDTQSSEVFELIEARYRFASTIFITQFDKAGWYSNLGESVVSDAILDRIVHSSYTVKIEGDISMRERYGLKN